jgi:hypothetical protein
VRQCAGPEPQAPPSAFTSTWRDVGESTVEESGRSVWGCRPTVATHQVKIIRHNTLSESSIAWIYTRRAAHWHTVCLMRFRMSCTLFPCGARTVFSLTDISEDRNSGYRRTFDRRLADDDRNQGEKSADPQILNAAMQGSPWCWLGFLPGKQIVCLPRILCARQAPASSKIF